MFMVKKEHDSQSISVTISVKSVCKCERRENNPLNVTVMSLDFSVAEESVNTVTQAFIGLAAVVGFLGVAFIVLVIHKAVKKTRKNKR